MNEQLLIMQGNRLPTVAILLLHFCRVQTNPITADSPPNCQSCHPLSDTRTNVHLVPHSHDDVGWVKTFSQYYYGTGVFDQCANAGVQYILNSTIKALKADPRRRFIQVETAFFWEWWLHQNNDTRQDVIDLVNSGRLEMVNGAWSMNDEATTHYQSIVDQFTWGFRILEQTVGRCGRPKIGWQIDPFGHSREHASLLKQFGFDGLVIGRLDYRDKNRRKMKRCLDFVWKTSDNLANSQIFTTMFPASYTDEDRYHFDIMYRDIIYDANLKVKVDGFANILNRYRNYYKTSNIMMPMGDDFTYQDAERNFENMDQLIKGFINHQDYNVFYSTPSCYIQAVQTEVADKSMVLEEKSDDFFPYASDWKSYWTGYFTSRPTLKRFERLANNILQSVKQLTAFSRINNQEYDNYTLDLRQAMGVLQHHDAITGTEQQAVANDYVRMLHQSLKKAEEPVSDIIINLLKLNVSEDIKLDFSTCLLSNISICTNSQKDKFLVAVQNPLARNITHYVRLPVDHVSYKITGPDGEEIYDMFDSIHSFDYVQTDESIAPRDLVFTARDLPPLGIKLYYIEKIFTEPETRFLKRNESNDLRFGTEVNGFTIDPDTGKLASVTLKGQTQEVTQEFLYYTTSSSGAYLFRPNESEAISIINQTFGDNRVFIGDLIDEYHQKISEEFSQIIRVYKNDDDAFIEFDWLVGDLQLVNGRGKEVITRYTIKDFNNNGTFYTDSNGREQIKRVLNHRNDYKYDPIVEPVASNYYPVTSKIVIKDETKRLAMAVLNDRAQGGTSLIKGSIELMLHRKLIQDDNLGVGEALKETQYDKGLYARGQHYLTFGSTTSRNVAAFERKLAQKKLLAPMVLIADATADTATLENIQNVLNFKFEGLKRSLPDNVHLLTLEPWIDSYILRLEHILEKDEDPELSKLVIIDLNDLFTLFSITEINETTLGANEYLEDDADLEATRTVTLNPMQIRTFIFKTDKNNFGGHANSDGDSDGDDGDDIRSGSYTMSSTISPFCVLCVICRIFVYI